MKSILSSLIALLFSLITLAQMPRNYLIIQRDPGNSDRFIPPVMFYFDSIYKEKDPHLKEEFCKSRSNWPTCLPKFFLLDSNDYLSLSLGIPKLEFKQSTYPEPYSTYSIYIYNDNYIKYYYNIKSYENYDVYRKGLFELIKKFRLDTNNINSIVDYL